MKTKTNYLKTILKGCCFAVLIILSISDSLFAQAGDIRGKVIDPNSETLPGAYVYVEVGGNKIGTVTDIDGKFVIKPLAPGKYNLTVSYVGFAPYKLDGIVVKPEKTTNVGDVSLSVNSLILVNIVDWKQKLIDPEEPTKCTVLHSTIANIPDNKSLKGILSSISSDVTVDDNGDVYFRGSRAGAEAYYVDGMLVKSIEGAVPGQSISSMTVYTGGVPSQYGDLTGGVVVINTKSYFELYNEWVWQHRND